MSPGENARAPAARWTAWVAALAVFLAAYLGFRDAPILLQFQGSQLVHSAHSFNAGLGLVIEPDKPLAKFPPLYALLLAPLEQLGFTVGAAACLINSFFLAISFVALAALGRALGASSGALLLGAWAALAPNLYLLRSVRPDFIPVCMSVIALVCLVRYAEKPGPGPLLGAAAAACSVAALSRYMALFALVPVATAAIFCWAPSGVRRIRDTALFAAVAAGPVLAWLARNVHLTGYASGMSRFDERGVRSEQLSLADNLSDIGTALVLDGFSYASLGVRLLGGEGGRPDLGLALAGAVAALALYGGAAFLGRREEAQLAEPAARRDRTGRAARLCRSFIACYLTALVLLWTFGNNDPINTRYVAPIYPFVLALTVRTWSRHRRAGARGPAAAVLVALTLALVPNAVKTVRLAGPAPNEQLIELRVWETRPPSWRHGIDWDDAKRVTHPLDSYESLEDSSEDSNRD